MKNKSILIVADSLECGGAEKSLLAFLGSLDPVEVEVTLMLSARGGVFEGLLPRRHETQTMTNNDKQFKDNEGIVSNCFKLFEADSQESWVKVVDVPRLTGIRGKMASMRYSWELRRKRNVGRHGAELYWECVGCKLPALSEHYDVAIAYHQGFPSYFVSEKVKADKKIAWVNTDPLAARYLPGFNKPFYDKMDQVVVVSEAMVEKLVKNGFTDKEPMVVYDMIDPNLIHRMAISPRSHGGHGEKKSSCRRELRVSVVRLCTVGRMVNPKNYRLAVEAARVLRDRGLVFVWYFVGDGTERATVENRIREYGLEDRIMLEGMQSNPYPWIGGCDVYVQTSSFEGFGLTIAEAKILHRPIVSTNFTVVTNQITDGVNGLIVEMTPVAVAEGIMRVIEDDGLRQRLVAATMAEENTTMQTEIPKIRKLLGLDSPRSHGGYV